MKYITLSLSLLITATCFGQDCSRYDKTVSISVGVPFNTVAEFSMQGDYWGASAGLKSFLVTTMHPQSQVKVEQDMKVEPFVKGYFKLLGDEDTQFRVYINAYWGIKVYGAGLKAGYVIGDDLLIFAEPSYGESKLQVNGGISFRL